MTRSHSSAGTARYSRVNARVWNDDKVRALSIEAKLLWFRLLVPTERTRVPGLFQAWPDAIKISTGVKGIAFDRAWREIADAFSVLIDEEWGLIYIQNAVKHDPPRNPNMVKGWVVALDDLPECELKVQAIRELKQFAEELGESFAKPLTELLGKYHHHHHHQHQHHHEEGIKPEASGSLIEDERKAKKLKADVNVVWNHYASRYDQAVNKKRRLGKAMRKKIETRLGEYTAEELTQAIDRMFSDEWSLSVGALELKRVVHSEEKVDGWLSKPDPRPNHGAPVKPGGRVIQIGGARPGDAQAARERLGIKMERKHD